MTEPIFRNREFDEFIVCKNCGHAEGMHKFDDYDGVTCLEEGCECTNFRPKVDSENRVVYEEEE